MIPSAVCCMYTTVRPVRSFCDSEKVCVQSLEVSAECCQVDRLWARGLHWLQNPFFRLKLLIHQHEPCPAVSFWIYRHTYSEEYQDKIGKREFFKQEEELGLVRRMRAVEFSSNSGKNPQYHLGQHCQTVMSERERNWSWNCHHTCKTS